VPNLRFGEYTTPFVVYAPNSTVMARIRTHWIVLHFAPLTLHYNRSESVHHIWRKVQCDKALFHVII